MVSQAGSMQNPWGNWIPAGGFPPPSVYGGAANNPSTSAEPVTGFSASSSGSDALSLATSALLGMPFTGEPENGVSAKSSPSAQGQLVSSMSSSSHKSSSDGDKAIGEGKSAQQMNPTTGTRGAEGGPADGLRENMRQTQDEIRNASKEMAGSVEGNQLQMLGNTASQNSEKIGKVQQLHQKVNQFQGMAEKNNLISRVLSGVATALDKVGVALTVAGTALVSTGQAMLSNPFTAAAGAALIAAGTALKVVGKVLKTLAKVLKVLSQVMEKVAQVLEKVVGAISKVLDKILDTVMKCFGKIGKQIAQLLAKFRLKQGKGGEMMGAASDKLSKLSDKAGFSSEKGLGKMELFEMGSTVQNLSGGSNSSEQDQGSQQQGKQTQSRTKGALLTAGEMGLGMAVDNL